MVMRWLSGDVGVTDDQHSPVVIGDEWSSGAMVAMFLGDLAGACMELRVSQWDKMGLERSGCSQ